MNGKDGEIMKLRNNMLFIVALYALWSCVQMDEADLGSAQELENVPLSMAATIENEGRTKTTLEGSLSDASMRTVWMPKDNIGIVAVRSSMGENERVHEFVTDVEYASETAVFYGAAPMVSEYYAFYPYSESLKNSNGNYLFALPQEQKYVPGSFDPQAAPMVAKAPRGEDFDFKNLCGLLALQLRGEESVKSITFMADDALGTLMTVSGNYSVNMTYENEPTIEQKEGQTSVTLICDTPVQLSQQATPFYFVLPPGEYNNFRIIIQTAEGKIMIKEGTKPLTISRSHVKPTAALQYAENVYVDLCEEGWANCYVVSKTGSYEFDANVIGNGEFGLIEGAQFHTEDVSIAPVTAEVLWEDKANLLLGVELKDGKVRFYSTGKEGNALIAVKDADGNILWSWHIWCTDVPVDQTYVNYIGTFVVQDRNLGAIRADRGVDDEWTGAKGILYQWGRKDPFIFDNNGAGRPVGDSDSDGMTIDESIMDPTCFSYPGGSWVTREGDVSLWSPTQKTIYDPCPVGYRVAQKEIWKDFSKTFTDISNNALDFNVSGSFDHGWDFYYDGINTTYVPASDIITTYYGYSHRDNIGDLWSSEAYGSDRAYRWNYEYYSDNSCRLQLWYAETTSYGLALRCMKDATVEAALVLFEGVNDITSSSASMSGYAYTSGKNEVERRGFVYGTNENPTLENAAVIECGSGVGDFSTELTGLSGLTKYYVRSFAVVGNESVYSDVRSFTTPDTGGLIDLSSEGTANCYIISQAGTYKFNASVKGNSTEAISAETVEVIWETLNTSDAVTQGAVIASVALENGYVKFTTPADFTPGNALVAVKSAGKILWSWHIWAVDDDMELNAQLYQNGALMMDRNLGALRVTPGDVRSFGLFYQWGRKDPFVGCGNAADNTFAATYPTDVIQTVDNNSNYDNYNYAEAHPTHFIKGSGWNNDDKYWGIHKTMYDPCPFGWRVPDFDTDPWGGFNAISYINNGAYFNQPLSEPDAYYPYSGFLSYYAELGEVNQVASVWYSTRGTIFRVASNVSLNYGSSTYNGSVVRCMKDAEFTVVTAAQEDLHIEATSITVPGELTIDDGTAMDVIGVIYSSESSDPRFGRENSVVVDSDKADAGEFSVTITGLKPRSRYWVRTYARGGHNMRYGEVREFWTKASGDNEGYGSEDFEW